MPGKFGDGQWSKFWGATNHMLDSVLPGSNPLNFTPPLLVNCPLLFHVEPPPPLFLTFFPAFYPLFCQLWQNCSIFPGASKKKKSQKKFLKKFLKKSQKKSCYNINKKTKWITLTLPQPPHHIKLSQVLKPK